MLAAGQSRGTGSRVRETLNAAIPLVAVTSVTSLLRPGLARAGRTGIGNRYGPLRRCSKAPSGLRAPAPHATKQRKSST